MFTINIYTPTEGVIGVKFDHIVSLDPYPDIPLFPDDIAIKTAPKLASNSEKGEHSLHSGGLTAEITENPYTVTFKAGTKVLTNAGPRYQGIYDGNSACVLHQALSYLRT